jgi:hypothetical protein
MTGIDDAEQRRNGLSVARWVLIAICAGLILFSDNMAGRLGFAALLLLAIFVGRYTSRRRTRVLETQATTTAEPQPSQPDLPRREAK